MRYSRKLSETSYWKTEIGQHALYFILCKEVEQGLGLDPVFWSYLKKPQFRDEIIKMICLQKGAR